MPVVVGREQIRLMMAGWNEIKQHDTDRQRLGARHPRMIRSRAGTSAFGIYLALLVALVLTSAAPSGCRARGLAAFGKRTHLPVMMLDLTEEEADALARMLRRTIDDDRYPLSPRIQLLKAILGKLRPEPERDPLPPLKHYEPPRATTARRRRAGH